MNAPNEERRPQAGAASIKSFRGDTPSVPGDQPVTASANVPDVYATALRLHEEGLRVVPVKADGTKAPALRGWPDHTTTPDDLRRWFAGPSPRYVALGMVCGPDGGNVEMLEVEGAHLAVCPLIYAAAVETGETELLHRLDGWSERSPSGGLHWYYRVTGGPVPGSTQLARTEDGAVMVETRGARGMSVLAPSSGDAHPSGLEWRHATGGPSTMPTFTLEERERIHALFRRQDRHRPPVPCAPTPRAAGHSRTTASAGDDFTARSTWAQVLEPHGWHVHGVRGEATFWTRPGKEPGSGPSATTGHTAADRLFVFSTNAAPFRVRTPYSRFAAYALLNHGGDYAAAARELGRLGYGPRLRGRR